MMAIRHTKNVARQNVQFKIFSLKNGGCVRTMDTGKPAMVYQTVGTTFEPHNYWGTSGYPTSKKTSRGGVSCLRRITYFRRTTVKSAIERGVLLQL